MNYINHEHKTTEALLMIKLVEECLSSGVANQFSDDALAGLSVSLKRARSLLSASDDFQIEKEPYQLKSEEIYFEPKDRIKSGNFELEVFETPSSNEPRRSFRESIKRERLDRSVQKESSTRTLAPNRRPESEIAREPVSRLRGQMGSQGPKINMNRKQLRASLEDY